MTTDNPSSVTVQRPQYNFMPSAQVSVTDAYHCLAAHCHVSKQDSGGLDHESWSSGHLLPDVDYAGPYPAMNYAPPPTRYNNSLGYDGLPHQATVSVLLYFSFPFRLTTASLKGPAEQQGNQGQRQPDGYHTPGITQYIPTAAGPPWLEQYVPAIPVRVSPPPFLRVYIQPFLLCF
jgi:hypothetical protein